MDLDSLVREILNSPTIGNKEFLKKLMSNVGLKIKATDNCW